MTPPKMATVRYRVNEDGYPLGVPLVIVDGVALTTMMDVIVRNVDDLGDLLGVTVTIPVDRVETVREAQP